MTEHSSPDHSEHEPPDQPPRGEIHDDLDPAALREALALMEQYAKASHGLSTAFLAYLDLDLPLESDDVAEADFRERYVGHFENRASFIRDRLSALGWDVALSEFMASEGMWEGDLHWDEEILWEHLTRSYRLVERFGGVYAFLP